jgi:hypothetical protein
MAADRGQNGFDKAELSRSRPKFGLARLPIENIKTANVLEETSSNDVVPARTSRTLSVAFGSSFRDMSLASGIR